MKITARCHPDLLGLLPAPIPASQALPDWLRQMPDQAVSEVLGGQDIRTLKHCPPVVDALRLGVLMLNPVDLYVSDGQISWAWEPPALPDTLITRAPIGVHVPEQVAGSPHGGAHLLVKFINFWTLDTPPGWSLLVQHPIGYPDLPFTTLTGVVDTDRFRDGYVHFPAHLSPDFEGVIAKGTPIAELTPVQKQVELETGVMSRDQITANGVVQEALGRETGVYRKTYRR